MLANSILLIAIFIGLSLSAYGDQGIAVLKYFFVYTRVVMLTKIDTR